MWIELKGKNLFLEFLGWIESNPNRYFYPVRIHLADVDWIRCVVSSGCRSLEKIAVISTLIEDVASRMVIKSYSVVIFYQGYTTESPIYLDFLFKMLSSWNCRMSRYFRSIFCQPKSHSIYRVSSEKVTKNFLFLSEVLSTSFNMSFFKNSKSRI